MSKTVWLVVVIALGVGAFFLLRNSNSLPVLQSTPKPMPSPSPELTLKDINSIRSTQPIANIQIISPLAQATVGKKFQVGGKARVFENQFSIRVKNNRTGIVLTTIQASAQAKGTGQFGNFTANIDLSGAQDLQDNDSLTIDAYDKSPKDGSEQDLVSVPLIYLAQ